MPEKSKRLLADSRKRRTYRQFLDKPVNLEIIKNCIMTAATAPSGADKQPWHFCVVTDAEMKQKIRTEAERIEESFYETKISEEWQADLVEPARRRNRHDDSLCGQAGSKLRIAETPEKNAKGNYHFPLALVLYISSAGSRMAKRQIGSPAKAD